jgi:hypothetical protein
MFLIAGYGYCSYGYLKNDRDPPIRFFFCNTCNYWLKIANPVIRAEKKQFILMRIYYGLIMAVAIIIVTIIYGIYYVVELLF